MGEQPALRAYRAGSSGTRAKGRPRKGWIDDMKAVFKNSMGLDMFEATQLAKTRRQTGKNPRRPSWIQSGSRRRRQDLPMTMGLTDVKIYSYLSRRQIRSALAMICDLVTVTGWAERTVRSDSAAANTAVAANNNGQCIDY